MERPEDRWVWDSGEVEGPYDLRQIMALRKKGKLSGDTLFYSPARDDWFPIRDIVSDYEPQDHLARMRQSGFERFTFSDSGTGEDCPACLALCNNVWSLSDPPTFPPQNCTCNPWCRIVPVVSE